MRRRMDGDQEEFVGNFDGLFVRLEWKYLEDYGDGRHSVSQCNCSIYDSNLAV